MRFLADAGISRGTVEFLRKLGHDAIHVRDLGMQRAADGEIIDRASDEFISPVTCGNVKLVPVM